MNLGLEVKQAQLKKKHQPALNLKGSCRSQELKWPSWMFLWPLWPKRRKALTTHLAGSQQRLNRIKNVIVFLPWTQFLIQFFILKKPNSEHSATYHSRVEPDLTRVSKSSPPLRSCSGKKDSRPVKWPSSGYNYGRNCAWKGNEWLREGLQPPSSRIMVHIPLPPALATHTFANKMRHLYYGRFIMPWQCSSELSPGLGSHVLRHAAATWASDRKAPQTEKNEHLRAGCGWRQRAMPTIKIRCNDRTCHDSHYRCQDTIYHPECN